MLDRILCFVSTTLLSELTKWNMKEKENFMKPDVQIYFWLFSREFVWFLIDRPLKSHFNKQASTIDGRRKGACLFCQEYFMDLYLLAELKTISLKVSFIEYKKKITIDCAMQSNDFFCYAWLL